MLGLKPQLNKIHNRTFLLTDGYSVPATASARNLGFISDSRLSFSNHISSVSLACFYHIRDHRRVRNDFNTARTIDTSCVHSRLDYCNFMYYRLPRTQLNRLQHIRNALARAVVAAPRSSNLDHILKSLHWLKVYRKALNTKLSPARISPCSLLLHITVFRDLTAVQPSRSTRSSTLVTLLQPPVDSSLKITNHSFRYAAPHFMFLIGSINHQLALLHRHALILYRLLTFLVNFSTFVLKLSISQCLSLHSRLSLPRADLES